MPFTLFLGDMPLSELLKLYDIKQSEIGVAQEGKENEDSAVEGRCLLEYRLSFFKKVLRWFNYVAFMVANLPQNYYSIPGISCT